MATSDKIKALKDLVAATPADPNTPSGSGRYRNPEQDILGYVLALYFLSKYKFFDQKGFTDYAKDMHYFRKMGDYSGPFRDMYKDLVGTKAPKLLDNLDQIDTLAKSLNFRPMLLKPVFRALRTKAGQIPHARIKLVMRQLSHYFEHGSKTDAALEKDIIKGCKPVVKHYRMKRMLAKVSDNLDDLVLAGDLYADDPDDTDSTQVDTSAPAAAKAAPAKQPAKTYTVDELKQMGRMELLDVARHTSEEKGLAKIIEATDDKVVLPYLAAQKAYFTDAALDKYEGMKILRPQWIANLPAKAKLALIKVYSDRNRRVPTQNHAIAMLRNANEAVVEAWLQHHKNFWYRQNTHNGRFEDALDKLFRTSPELLTPNVIKLLMKSPYRSTAINSWLPTSEVMDLADKDNPAALIELINRSAVPEAVKLIREYVPQLKPGTLANVGDHVPLKWQMLCWVSQSYSPATYTIWRDNRREADDFLSNSSLIREFPEQAEALVQALPTNESKSYSQRDLPRFHEVWEDNKYRQTLVKYATRNQIESLDDADSDADAVARLREIAAANLATQKAWWDKNWDDNKFQTAGYWEFNEAAENGPPTELVDLADYAAQRDMPVETLLKIGYRIAPEYLHKLITSDKMVTSGRDLTKLAARVPADHWLESIDTDDDNLKLMVCQYLSPEYLQPLLDKQEYKGKTKLRRILLSRVPDEALKKFWNDELRDEIDEIINDSSKTVTMLAERLEGEELVDLATNWDKLTAEARRKLLERLPEDQLVSYLDRLSDINDDERGRQLATILRRSKTSIDRQLVVEHIEKNDIKDPYTLDALIEVLPSSQLSSVIERFKQQGTKKKRIIAPLFKKLGKAEATEFGAFLLDGYLSRYAYGSDMDHEKFIKECLTTETLGDILAQMSSPPSDRTKSRWYAWANNDRVDQFLNNLNEARETGQFDGFVDQLMAQAESGDIAERTFAEQAIESLTDNQNRGLLGDLLATGNAKLTARTLRAAPASFVLKHIPTSEVRANFDKLFDKVMPKEIKSKNDWVMVDTQIAFLKAAPANKLIKFYEWAYEQKVLPANMADVLAERVKEWLADFKGYFLSKNRDFRNTRWVKGSFPIVLASDDNDILERIQKTRIGRDIKIGASGDITEHYDAMPALQAEQYLTGLDDRVLVEKLFYGQLQKILPLQTKVEQALAISTSAGTTNTFISKLKTKFKETALSVAVYEILRYKTLDEIKDYIRNDPLDILEFAKATQKGDTLIDEVPTPDLEEIKKSFLKAWDHSTHSSFTAEIQSGYRVEMKAKPRRKSSKNIRTFYHGTSYYAAGFILQNGFKILRTAKAGRMLGDGIYFSDVSSKAAQYVHQADHSTSFNRGDNDGVILICEVDMGKMITLTNTNFHQYQRDWNQQGYDSVFAPKGVNWLRNNEFVVRDVQRITVTHVLDTKKKRKY